MAINFEKIHNDFDGMMLDLCTECGGKCEQNELTILLPGEEDFISKKLGMTKEDFLEQNCNKLLFKGFDIYILKAGVCPFLNNEFRCDLEKANCKLVRCLLYPVLIGITELNAPKIFLDST